jgi:hypothetical protein
MRVQDEGVWILSPPSSVLPGVGAIMSDSAGNILGVTDRDYEFDLAKFGEPGQGNVSEYGITLPAETDDASGTQGLYRLRLRPRGSKIELVNFWHRILGHLPLENLVAVADAQIFAGLPTGAEVRQHWTECVFCIQGNMRRRPMPKTANVTRTPITAVGDRVQADGFGGIKEKSAGGNDHSIHFFYVHGGYVYGYTGDTRDKH